MKLACLPFTCGLVCAAALSPEQERASFHLADSALTIELVASEPNVISPVAIAWDVRGRMFVAEMIDYPVGPGQGQIRMLEDLDDKGVYEKSTVFADQLSFPNGVLPWKDGLLVTAAPNILFLKDTNGDGRADERRVVLTGFAEGNQQLRVNGLIVGLDGWVYGANGRSDGELRLPGQDKGVSLRGFDFRFQPDTGDFETVAGRSQFGLGYDDWGNRFLSWNTIAIRHEVIPERLLAQHPNMAVSGAVHDLTPAGDDGAVFPISSSPHTFNNESITHFNALAGLTIYRGDALPSRYYGNAFVGETLRNLVHRRVLEATGATFVARRVEQGREFLASTDPWFHPVNFATGPDGALYVVDFYRQWVEHPGFVPEKLREQHAWRAGAEHGRIWRVRPRNWTQPAFPRAGFPSLAALDDPNGWRRDTAFRSVLDHRDGNTIEQLRQMARRHPSPEQASRLRGTVLALHLLARAGQVDRATTLAAVANSNAAIREAAARLAFSPKLLEDPAANVRFQALVGETNPIATDVLLALATRPDLDRITAVAIRARSLTAIEEMVEKLIRSRPAPTEPLLGLAYGLGQDLAWTNQLARAAKALGSGSGSSLLDLALLGGFTHVAKHLPDDFAATAHERFGTFARETIADTAEGIAQQSALQVLAFTARAENTPTILGYLMPTNHSSIQLAAARALVDSGETSLYIQALAMWERLQISTRRQLLQAGARSTATAAALVEAMHVGTVSPAELDPFLRQNLLRMVPAGTVPALERLVGPSSSPDRAAVIERFSAALQLNGSNERGRILFEKSCAQCHTFGSFRGNVGPNLSGIKARPKEALLVDILDPSRQVSPEFLSYTVLLANDESVTGLLVSENATSVTLRRPNLADESIPRTQIKRIYAGSVSLMPEGFDAGTTPADMADLLSFLTAP